jgi:hypothetical protein
MTKPRPVGRPPRARKMSAVRFELRLTARELDRWKRAARREGLELAAFVREAVEIKVMVVDHLEEAK